MTDDIAAPAHERLRRRTHEIQADESRKRAKLESDLARCRSLLSAAHGLSLERIDPETKLVTHGDGKHLGGISAHMQGIVAGLIERAEDAESENERLRAIETAARALRDSLKAGFIVCASCGLEETTSDIDGLAELDAVLSTPAPKGETG